jgi:hypothetical protein
MAITYNNVNSTANGAVGSSGYVYATSATGSAGQFLTSGSNGTSWANPATTFNSSNHKTIMTIPHGEDKIVLENSATFEVKGNVVINGIDLEERLKTIEKVLMIPERDAKMEAKYPSLKKKYDEYINALGKYRTFEAIKGNDE